MYLAYYTPRFQSTLPVRGATNDILLALPKKEISIHAPRAGSDEDDANEDAPVVEFQSTLPVRGATTPDIRKAHRYDDFNPRSPCGERHGELPDISLTQYISIHAPRAGSDMFSPAPCGASGYFNPRSPCGERLEGIDRRVTRVEISIHAPRAGSDAEAEATRSLIQAFQSTLPVRGATRGNNTHPGRHRNFNPRSPCGERR